MAKQRKPRPYVQFYHWYVTFENGHAYHVPDYSEWSLKRKLHKYFPSPYVTITFVGKC